MSLAFCSDLRRPLPAAGDAFDEKRVLGGALVGDPSASRSPWPWPVQTVLAPVLGDTRDSVQERWTADGECQAGEFKGIAFRRSRDILFGVIELDEHAFSAAGETRSLQAATEEAYRRIFQLLAAQDLPHLWRVWNYLADINRDTNGLERYRQFNIGRYDAFVAFDRAATGNVPAACTIGLRQGRLSVAFIAGRLAGRPVENPRQVSAYHYPAEYGPRSPTFSRAVLVTLPGQASLFISGTASIVGHRTVHPGDVAGQSREALANVEALIVEAKRLSPAAAFTLAGLSYRVYVRHAADYPVVRDVLAERLGEAAEVLFVQADICRHDLLVEIEAIASTALGSC